MPIYEYRRPDGTTFEIQQSFSEDALENDPDTGVPVERVMHAPAIHFKGKGFYNTDYGTRNRERETAAAAAESSSSSKDSSTSSESSSKESSSKESSSTDGSSSSSDGKAKSEKSSGDSGKSKGSKPVAAKK